MRLESAGNMSSVEILGDQTIAAEAENRADCSQTRLVGVKRVADSVTARCTNHRPWRPLLSGTPIGLGAELEATYGGESRSPQRGAEKSKTS